MTIETAIEEAVRKVIRTEILPELRRIVAEVAAPTENQPEYIMRRAQLAERFGCSMSTVDKIAAQLDFPKRGQLGWRVSEIEAWEDKSTKRRRAA